MSYYYKKLNSNIEYEGFITIADQLILELQFLIAGINADGYAIIKVDGSEASAITWAERNGMTSILESEYTEYLSSYVPIDPRPQS